MMRRPRRWMTTESQMERLLVYVAAILTAAVLAACTPPTLPNLEHTITIVADGERQQLTTGAGSVRQVLGEAGIELGDLDRVSPPEVTTIQDDITITVVRVSQTTKVIAQILPFERQVIRDATIPEGESKLLQSGRSGTIERRYLITFEDHVEIDRILIEERIIDEAQNEVRLIGSKPQLEQIPITGTLAYQSNQDAWLIRDHTFQRRRLTHQGDLDGRVFSLSPDGQLLLFTRAATETDRINDLWIIRTSQASPNPVPLGLTNVLWADWSPDGATLAWTTAEPTDTAPGWRGQNDLWTADLSQQNTLVSRRQILEAEAGGGYGWWGTRYTWAPDGEYLAFSRPESMGVVAISTREQSTLMRFPAFRSYSSWTWNPDITWSPDSNFTSAVVHIPSGEEPEESPVFNLLSLEAEGAYSGTLAVEVGMWAAPRFSPDGDQILFGRAIVPYQSANSHYTLHLIDRDGSNQRTLYAPDDGTGLEVPVWSWSPDGLMVLLIRFGDLYLLPIDGDAIQPITDEGNVTHVSWR